MKKEKTETADQKVWQKTQYANLVRYVPRGTYYARLRVGGKLIRRSLKTKTLTVAKLKLADLEKAERKKVEGRKRVADGKAVAGDMLKIYLERLEANAAIKPSTKKYWQERIVSLRRTWPGFDQLDVRKITEDDCRAWSTNFRNRGAKKVLPKSGSKTVHTNVGPSNYNNTISLLKKILEIAVEQGLRYSNPANCLTRIKVRQKHLNLPSQSQFHALLAEIRRVPYGAGLAAADLVEFLAYSGMRVKSEAAFVVWADCDFDRGEILVKGDPETGTKNWSVRRIPMIPDMRKLLKRLKLERWDWSLDQKVMRIVECQGTINRACKALDIVRFTHHDLRHLFATRCIESGVDVPTVSRWLGHKDGGALAMKVYGHLRDQHSVEMAQKVTFEEPPADDNKIIQLGLQ